MEEMTKAQAAAFSAFCKLSQDGRVRTHLRPPPPQVGGPRVFRKRVVTGAGRGGLNKRAVRIAGKTYSSIKTARVALGVGNSTMRKWIASGRARILKPA